MPYLSPPSGTTTITVTWDSGDSAAWVVATANAYITEQNSVRIVILEDYYMYICYGDRLLRYHRNTATTTEGYTFTASGTKTETEIVADTSNNGYWLQPCSTTTETNRTAIAAQINGDTQTLTTGTLITDMNLPDTYANSFTYDGSLQIDPADPDAGDAIKFTAAEARDNQTITMHQNVNWGIKTVNSTPAIDEHLIALWDCASTTLNKGTGSVTVANATYSSAKKGNGVLIDANAEVAYIQSSGNVQADAGNITFDVIDSDGTGTANARFFQHSSATDELELYWTNATTIVFNVNQTTITFTVGTDPLDGNWHTVSVSWDTTNSICQITIDGEVQDTDFTTITAPTMSSGNLYIGNGSAGNNPINGIIDNFKSYNTNIRNHGAYYTGIGSTPGSLLSVNTNVAHSDVTLFTPLNSLSSATLTTNSLLSSGSITVNGTPTQATGIDGIIDSSLLFSSNGQYITLPTASNLLNTKGSISCWLKSNSSFTDGSNRRICGAWTGSTTAGSFLIWKRSTPELAFYIVDNGGTLHYVRYDATTTVDDNWISWNHYRFVWDSTAKVDGTYYMALYLNNTLLVPTANSTPTSFTAGALNTSFGIGDDENGANVSNCYIDEFYITNNQNTPQLWTAGYRPILLPVIDVS